ncbi:hypothetical protein ABZ599_16775 [Streptomyces misionensis]|uniref:hypothetical protein n=1 Tax=Streptomyces misionensis TaxID=67331 RepID=UPI0033EFBCBD
MALWPALTAGLPAGALAGSGAFADAAVDDADLVAERAAGHPGSKDALLLAANWSPAPPRYGGTRPCDGTPGCCWTPRWPCPRPKAPPTRRS